MRRTIGVLWLSVLFVVGCSASPGAAQTPPPAANGDAAAATTIWDGVYTVEQATRGERAARETCFSCHAQTEWANPMFLVVWSGRSIHDLYENLRMTMPYDAPGRLSREEYADIVAFMLRLNSVPEGEAPLPSDAEGLAAIEVTPPPEQ